MSKNESTYFLSISFLVLTLIFIILTLYSIPCIVKSFRSKANHFFPKVFYVFICITSVYQATYQSVFCVQVFEALIDAKKEFNNDEFQILFIQTLYVPDAIFFIVYVSLFWQYVIMVYQGRMKTGNMLLQKYNWNPENSNPIIRFILYLYIIGQSAIVWIYSEGYISPAIIMILDIVVNAIVPLIVLIMGLYLNFRFSGTLFVSNEYEKRYQKVQFLLAFWIILRVPQLAVNILGIVYNSQLNKLFNGELEIQVFTQLLLAFLVVGDVIIVQIIPLIMAMSTQFVNALLLNKVTLLNKDSVENEEIGRNQVLESIHEGKEQINLINLKFEQIVFLENIFYKRFNGLGEIKVGYIGTQREYCFRFIELKELSQFLIDEIHQEVQKSNIQWFDIRQNKIIFMSKYYKQGTLSSYIHIKKEMPISSQLASQNPTQEVTKLNIAIEIAKKLQDLHNKDIIHGHLHSNNILFNKSYNIKIVDYGLRALKKYCGLVNGYSNKSGFTAPECLEERGNVVSARNKASDIYSFGMIIYELFNEKVPFAEIPVRQIQQLVVEQQSRPKISDSLNDQLTILIRYCWQQDPQKRPQLSQIIDTLKEIKHQND